MNLVSLIEKKRDGQALSGDEIRRLLQLYTAGQVPDYQMAALLMAVFFRGLDADETRAWTLAMRDSGDHLEFPDDPRPLVDKHSTGGVGDKVSLPLAPLLACLGFRVPMISGRGLGITGGTLDKLEAIPGFRTDLPPDRVVRQVQEVGCVIAAQSERMVPADRALYALRDVTGTVPSIPLIVASILSKKLAESLDVLVLDVKFGAAAFMREEAAARELAVAMTRIAGENGVKTSALLTDMNAPLGCAAGNWLEVKESVECLNGRGPEDLRRLVVECAAQILRQTGWAQTLDDARAQAEACLASGVPLTRWRAMLEAQGTDLAAYDRKLAQDVTAPRTATVKAPQAGFIARCDARQIGELVRDLGGGRLTKTSIILPEVGVDQLAKPGEWVERGAVLGRVHVMESSHLNTAEARLEAAFAITAEPPVRPPLVAERLDETNI